MISFWHIRLFPKHIRVSPGGAFPLPAVEACPLNHLFNTSDKRVCSSLLYGCIIHDFLEVEDLHIDLLSDSFKVFVVLERVGASALQQISASAPTASQHRVLWRVGFERFVCNVTLQGHVCMRMCTTS